MSRHFDAIIVGAGLNGLTAALAIAGPKALRPMRVAVVDRLDPRTRIAGKADARASAITASSRRMFEALGVWEKLANQAQDITEIIVTDGSGEPTQRPTLLRFGAGADAGESKTVPAACMIENAPLLEALFTSAAQSSHIQYFFGHGVENTDFGPGLSKLSLSSGESLSAALVIGADGGRSPLRQAAQIELVGWSYEQMGLVVTFAHELPHGGRAEEHFTPSGPFAILPLTANRSSTVWTKKTADGKRLLQLPTAEFEKELQSQIGNHLGKITLIGQPQGYPLAMFIAKQFHGTRLALVGDAAHIIHPLAGLGLNLGLRDAAALAQCLSEAYGLGLDIGAEDVLERYTRWRRFETVTTAASMDGMNRIFSNDIDILKTLRQTVLRATDQNAGLKRMFEKEAAGQNGDLPKLLRGELV